MNLFLPLFQVWELGILLRALRYEEHGTKKAMPSGKDRLGGVTLNPSVQICSSLGHCVWKVGLRRSGKSGDASELSGGVNEWILGLLYSFRDQIGYVWVGRGGCWSSRPAGKGL